MNGSLHSFCLFCLRYRAAAEFTAYVPGGKWNWVSEYQTKIILR